MPVPSSKAVDELQGGADYAWEKNFPRSWDAIREDEHGHLRAVESVSGRAEALRNQIREKLKGKLKRGIMRHLVVVIDASLYAAEQDWSSSRIEIVVSALRQFTLEYFEQNPISQLGFILTRNGVAETFADMCGNAETLLQSLKNNQIDPQGDPSLQNSLLLSRSLLLSLSGRAAKEVLVLYSSLSSCDPSDVMTTLNDLEKDFIRVSIICLCAELRICQKICGQTKGSFAVALNHQHFIELLMAFTTPFPLDGGKRAAYKLLKMGFPTKVVQATPTLCACHQKLTYIGYLCPNCGTKMCHLPGDCSVCGLTLVLSPHLARSYHHLFPIAEFKPVQIVSSRQTNGNQEEVLCIACSLPIVDDKDGYECPLCQSIFCSTCNKFIQEMLHSCPGCLSKGQSRGP